MGVLLDQRSVALELETSMSPRRPAILAPALVTAQPRFDAHGRLIGAGISICRERVSLEHNAGIEMDHALGAKAESLPPYGHVSRKSAVEVFGHRFGDTRIDALAQRPADADVFARHAKWHDRPPMPLVGRPSRLDGHGGPRRTRTSSTLRRIPVRRKKGRSTISQMVRQEAAPSAACFSRRRCTDEEIRIASRYFATVRRAMSIPASCSFSTMVSSDSTCSGLSASISCLIRWRTASAEWASPPSAEAIAEVKKYFSSKIPRLVAIYLLAVTRETVDSCILIASAMVLRLSGRKCSTPCAKKPSCWRTISVATLRIVFARCSSARTSQVAVCMQSA